MSLSGIDTIYQTEIQVNTLYQTGNLQQQGLQKTLVPCIEVIGGDVDIYGSFVAPIIADAPDGMSLTQAGFTGITGFGVVPNYIYLDNTDGDVTSVVISGIQVTEVM